jgi:hypothetical protein
MGVSPEDRFAKYLKNEYPAAAKFYDDRAVGAKRWYRFLSIYLITMSAALTVVTGLSFAGEFWKVAVPIASATIGIAAALLAHFKFHENWLSYRATWDALERERRYFEAGTEKYYGQSNPGDIFVSQVEAIRAQEADDFYARHRKTDEHSNVTSIEMDPTKQTKKLQNGSQR